MIWLKQWLHRRSCDEKTTIARHHLRCRREAVRYSSGLHPSLKFIHCKHKHLEVAGNFSLPQSRSWLEAKAPSIKVMIRLVNIFLFMIPIHTLTYPYLQQRTDLIAMRIFAGFIKDEPSQVDFQTASSLT